MHKVFRYKHRVEVDRICYLIAIGILALGIAFFSQGCASKPTVQQYQMLNAAADLRLAVLQGAGDYYRMGLLDEELKDQIIEIDAFVQEAGRLATTALNEVVMLERLRELDPEAVTPEEYATAVQKYQDAKAKFRAEWRRLTTLVDPFLMKWLQDAAAKQEGG